MKTLRMLFAGTTLLLASQALADISPPPPPQYGDCVAAKQRKSPGDDCQECNGLLQDTCEKQWKDKGYVRSCQLKPENSSEWREVWCKNGTAAAVKEPVKEPANTTPAPRTATETTKNAGCSIDPAGSASWLSLLAFGLLLRRNRRASPQNNFK